MTQTHITEPTARYGPIEVYGEPFNKDGVTWVQVNYPSKGEFPKPRLVMYKNDRGGHSPTFVLPLEIVETYK